jgi:hypothetical protein
MTGTHTLEDLQDTNGFHMTKSGIIATRYGSNTINYWRKCENGLYKNYDCKTVY